MGLPDNFEGRSIAQTPVWSGFMQADKAKYSQRLMKEIELFKAGSVLQGLQAGGRNQRRLLPPLARA